MAEITIWKYKLKIGIQTIRVPSYATFLMAGEKGNDVKDEIYIWAQHTFSEPENYVEKIIDVVPTGGKVQWNYHHINSFIAKCGEVYHVYEIK